MRSVHLIIVPCMDSETWWHALLIRVLALVLTMSCVDRTKRCSSLAYFFKRVNFTFYSLRLTLCHFLPNLTKKNLKTTPFKKKIPIFTPPYIFSRSDQSTRKRDFSPGHPTGTSQSRLKTPPSPGCNKQTGLKDPPRGAYRELRVKEL
jgi:hypothetical protein